MLISEVVGESFEVVSYLVPRDFSYHLSEIGRGLVNLLEFILERESEGGGIAAAEVLRKLAPIEVHFENLSLLRGEVRSFRDKYDAMKRMIIEEYSADLRTPLSPNHREILKITLAGLLEYVYLLIAKGLGTFLSPSTVVYARKFPENLKLKVKIGEVEGIIDRTFIIGRLSDDYVGVRIVPYQMSLKELAEKAKSETEIEGFPILFRSREKVERKEGYPTASRLHVVVFHDGSCFRIFDISNSETIVEIDGDARKLIGHRARPYLPLLSLPLGESNKFWIDPVKGVKGTPVEITILR